MKSTTFTILAAAFASVCSAAPTASAAALPAKFTLSYVPTSGTALPASGGTIVSEEHYGFSLYLSQPTTTNKSIVTFTGSNTSAFVHHPEFDRNFDWYISTLIGGAGSVNLNIPDDIATGKYTSKGFGSVNGGLTWDFADGKGPQALWSACNSGGDWTLYWAKAGAPGCVKVDLKIKAL